MKYETRFEFYEKLYFHEVDLREKIESRYRTPLSLFAVVFGLIAYLSRELFSKDALPYNYGVWLPYVACILAFVTAVYFLCRALYGYHYILMPTPEILEEYRKTIREKYYEIDPAHAIVWTEQAFEDYLFKIYIDYTTQNTRNNDAKAFNLSWCMRALIGAFFCIGIAYIPYFISTYYSGA